MGHGMQLVFQHDIAVEPKSLVNAMVGPGFEKDLDGFFVCVYRQPFGNGVDEEMGAVRFG